MICKKCQKADVCHILKSFKEFAKSYEKNEVYFSIDKCKFFLSDPSVVEEVIFEEEPSKRAFSILGEDIVCKNCNEKTQEVYFCAQCQKQICPSCAITLSDAKNTNDVIHLCAECFVSSAVGEVDNKIIMQPDDETEEKNVDFFSSDDVIFIRNTIKNQMEGSR